MQALTLIMPVYGREEYTHRNMRYFSGTDFILHVIDGSPLEIKKSDLEIYDENIHYHYIPKSINERLMYALNLVKTQYVSLISNDDIFLKNGLHACVNELDKDMELVSCGGCAMRFNYNNGKINAFVTFPEMINSNLADEDPIVRMYNHFDNYAPSHVYSVTRTDVWKRACYDLLKKENNISEGVFEQLYEISVVFFGKTKVLKRLVWCRSAEVESVGYAERYNTEIYGRMKACWYDKNYSEQKNNFLDMLAINFADSQEEYTFNEVRNGIIEALNCYADKSVPSTSSSLLKKNIPFLYKIIDSILYRLINKYQSIHGGDLVEGLESLKAKGVYVDSKEMNEFSNTINDFHKNKLKKTTRA